MKTFGERLVTYGKAAGLFAAASIAVYGAFLKGEPVAQQAQQDVNQAWDRLKEKVQEQNSIINKQSTVVEKLARRIVHMQGVQEGFQAGKLFERVGQLQKENERLRKRRRVPVIKVPRMAKPAPPPSPVQKLLPKATPLRRRKGK